MKTLTINTKLAEAEILGTQAFIDGKKRIPAHDSNFIILLGNVNSSALTIELLKAWLRNWDLANLRRN